MGKKKAMDFFFSFFSDKIIQFSLYLCYYIGVQRTEEQMEDVKGQMEDTKIQLENTKTELNETKIKFEDTKIQLKESKIQSKETNIKLEESKIKIEETKSQLDESLIQLEDTKIQLEYFKTKSYKLDKKLADIYEYTKDPCKNCNGSTICLDGQAVRNTPGKGTKIKALKDITFRLPSGSQFRIPANGILEVDIVLDRYPPFGPLIKWDMIGQRYSHTTGFVYDCK